MVSHGDALRGGQRVTSNTVLFWDRDTSFLPVQISHGLCKVESFTEAWEDLKMLPRAGVAGFRREGQAEERDRQKRIVVHC